MSNKFEITKRAMYECLDRIRRAAKHRVLTDEFEGKLEEHLEVLRKERDNFLATLSASGDELIRAQKLARQFLDDCRHAEKYLDDENEKLRAAQAVIAQQEQLIAGQRKAIADMHTELTHSRAIRKAFQGAQSAFVAMDEALHGQAPYAAQKAVGDDTGDLYQELPF